MTIPKLSDERISAIVNAGKRLDGNVAQIIAYLGKEINFRPCRNTVNKYLGRHGIEPNNGPHGGYRRNGIVKPPLTDDHRKEILGMREPTGHNASEASRQLKYVGSWTVGKVWREDEGNQRSLDDML